VLASPFLEPELRGPLMDQAANAAYGLKDWAKASLWGRRALDNGIATTMVRLRLAQSLYFQGQHADAASTLVDLATAQRRAGERPGEPQLRLQASNFAKLNDEAGYARSLEELLALYPKPETWADRLSRLVRQPGFDDRLAIDALRMGHRLQAWTTPDLWLWLADEAQRAGFVAEARQVVEAGFERGLLGQGAKAAEHQALRQRLQRQFQSDPAPDAKAAAGREPALAFVTGWDLYTRGQAADGIALMQQAVQRGLPKNADDAKLRLASALVGAGRAEEARPLLLALRDGGSRDGLADLARLWLLQIPARS
jgi:Tetratrico peptide repeat